MSQPATAGIIVACIFVGMAVLYFGYRGYVKWHRRKTTPTDSELPPIRELQPSYIAGGTANSANRPWPVSMSSMGTLYGDQTPGKLTQSGSRPSLGGGSIFRQSLGPADMTPIGQQAAYYNHSRRNSAAGITGPTTADSSVPGSPIASPTEMGVLSPIPQAATGSSMADSDAFHSRMSSASSTMTLKRTYAGSVYKGSVGSSGFASSPTFEKQQRRDSWLPHSPLNRDSIHIVPPQPLGVGFGSLATAMDERTLAFSKTSGIGSGEEIFGQGLVWGAPGSNQMGPAPAGTQAWGALSPDQRHRYLQEGPSRGLAASNPSSSSLGRASVSNGSGEGSRTGHSSSNGLDSRSRSPAFGAAPSSRQGHPHAAAPGVPRSRATSTTNSAEGVDATQGELPFVLPHQQREALSHLKAVSSSSDAYANPAAFTAQTSPLQALSQQHSGVTSFGAGGSTVSSLKPSPLSPSSGAGTAKLSPSLPDKEPPSARDTPATGADVQRYHSAASSYHPGQRHQGASRGTTPTDANTSAGGSQSPILGAFNAGESPASQPPSHSNRSYFNGASRNNSPSPGKQHSSAQMQHGASATSSADEYAGSGKRVMLGQGGKLEVSNGH